MMKDLLSKFFLMKSRTRTIINEFQLDNKVFIHGG